jgi:hypothetical protein
MKTSIEYIKPPAQPRRSSLKRRIRISLRLAIRRLLRGEVVETDSQGNPKVNHLRWMV